MENNRVQPVRQQTAFFRDTDADKRSRVLNAFVILIAPRQMLCCQIWQR